MREILRTIETIKLRELLKDPFYVYGHGAAAKRFTDQLYKYGYSNNMLGIIVTDKKNETEFGIDEIQDKCAVIFIAMHDVNAYETQALMDSRNFENYYWVYPNIFDLEIGEPEEVNVEVEVCELVRNLAEYYRYLLAVFLYFIEGTITNREDKKDIYIKLQELLADNRTAKRKAAFFSQKIEAYSEYEYDKLDPIFINHSRTCVIDGMHRLALALYYKKNTVKCNIYADEKGHMFENRLKVVYDNKPYDFDMSIIENMEKIK